VAHTRRPTASEADHGNHPSDTGGHCPPATGKTRNPRAAPRAGRPPIAPYSIRRHHRTAPAEAPRRFRRRRRPPGAVRPHAEGVAAPDFPLRQGGSAPRGARAAVVTARIGRREDLPPSASPRPLMTTVAGEDARHAPAARRPPIGPRLIRRGRRRGPNILQRRRRAPAPRRWKHAVVAAAVAASQGRCARTRRALRPPTPPTPGRKRASLSLRLRRRSATRTTGRPPPVGVTVPADDDGGRRRRASRAGGKMAANWAALHAATPPQRTEHFATAPPRPSAAPAEAPRRHRRRRRPPGAVRPHAEGAPASSVPLRRGGSVPRGARAAVVAARIGRRNDLPPSASPRPPTTTGVGQDAGAPRICVAVSHSRCRQLSRLRCPWRVSRRPVHDPSRAGRCMPISARPRAQVRRHACGRGRDCRPYLKYAEEGGDADHRHWRRRI